MPLVVTPPESARLVFRQYSAADEAHVFAMFGDADARLVYPEMTDRARARRWIDWNVDNYREFGYGLWALELRESGAFVGDCGLTWQDVEGRRELEIGYHLAAAFRGRGYATEAARAALDFAWRHTHAQMVCSIVRPANTRSCAVARRVHGACRAFDRNGSMLLFYTLRRV